MVLTPSMAVLGTDTYDGNGVSGVTINLDTVAHFTVAAQSADRASVGSDHVRHFENASGGISDDVLIGFGAANTLIGGDGLDQLYGLGGRDVLTGSDGNDTFHFVKLTDSGTRASARDLITDFTPGEDKIDLTAIDANRKTATNDAFHLTGDHGLAAFTHHAASCAMSQAALTPSYRATSTVTAKPISASR
jgi:Ca2+-binding RTX toxin-like protein